MREKSDIFFGISIFLAIAGFIGTIIYIASANPENKLNNVALIGLISYVASWIGIYLTVKFEKTDEELEDEDLLDALDNIEKIKELKSNVK